MALAVFGGGAAGVGGLFIRNWFVHGFSLLCAEKEKAAFGGIEKPRREGEAFSFYLKFRISISEISLPNNLACKRSVSAKVTLVKRWKLDKLAGDAGTGDGVVEGCGFPKWNGDGGKRYFRVGRVGKGVDSASEGFRCLLWGEPGLRGRGVRGGGAFPKRD